MEADKNAKVYYLDYILSFFYIPIAVWPLIWGKYINFAQVGIIYSAGFVAETILQLPTGALADMIGRKKIIVLAKIFKVLGVLGIIFANNFWFFLIAQLFDSSAEAFYAGSASALVYDSFKKEGRSKDYQKIESRGYLLATLGFVVASIIGGFAYSINPILPYILLLIPDLINVINVTRYTENNFEKSTVSLRSYIKQNYEGFVHIFRDKLVSLVSLYSLVITFVFLTGLWMLYQKSGNEMGLSPTTVGFLIAGMYLCRAFGTWAFPYFRSKIPENNFAIILAAVQGLSSFLLIVPNIFIAVCGLGIRYITDGLRLPFLTQVQNDMIDSRLRATSLSALALLVSLVLAVTNPIMGSFVDSHGARTVMAVTGLLPLFLGIPLAIALRKKSKRS